MTEHQLKRFLLLTGTVAAAVLCCYVLLRWLLPWLAPFLFAAAVAALLEPAVGFLQKRFRFRRGFASLVLTLFALFLLGGLLSLLGTALSLEARAFLSRAPALLDAAPAAVESLLRRAEAFGTTCPPWLRETLELSLRRSLSEAEDLLGMLSGRLITALAAFAAAVPGILLGVATSVLAIYFTLSSIPDMQAIGKLHFSAEYRQKMSQFCCGISRSALRWLRAELTLCGVTFCELLAGFLLLRQNYALLLAFSLTLVDALPVFGTGTVLIPWFLIELLFGNITKSILLGLLYVVTLTVRSVLEPHLLGAQAGLPPLASLLAMYLGFRTFGLGGMILFPFLLLLASQLRREQKETASRPSPLP